MLGVVGQQCCVRLHGALYRRFAQTFAQNHGSSVQKKSTSACSLLNLPIITIQTGGTATELSGET